MLGNMLKRTLQVLELIRLTDEKRMQTYGHAARVGSALFIEHIKLINDHVAEGFRGHTNIHKRGDVVEFNGIGHSNKLIFRRIETKRMIVSGIVTEILNTILLQQSRRVISVRKER